ncbi:MAG: FAD-dependent thymidylate synthase [Chloroflexota bacterium]|nr:FAD-dependent thymidylate synthase [Dehalococcoidia bacterium]MDW8254983.1 FAD-dependent thymidylate synthase [Chloroflexota bacterium]
MRIYSVTGVPPEIQAYAMAKYSRSSQSMLESITELNAEKAERFLETFYFQYGHRSIADLAHLFFAVEDISILAAIVLVDEPLWDGQERSTRYQDFSRTGYIVPPGLEGDDAEFFRAVADRLFAEYRALTETLLAILTATVPRPAAMDERDYRRTLRARAFDVTRGLLPLATATSVGQVVSARVLERQISRLLANEYEEVRQIGQELRAACQRPAEAPLLEAIRNNVAAVAAHPELPASARAALEEVLAWLTPTPVAPTLVKYTHPDRYSPHTHEALVALARRELNGLPPDMTARVALADDETPLDEVVATALFSADQYGRSYRQVQGVVRSWSDERKHAVLDLTMRCRGRHDDLLRLHRSGYAVKFDLLIDLGAYRDFHRHRRCVQILQPLSPIYGVDPAAEVFREGLGEAAEAALAAGLHQRYADAIAGAHDAVRQLASRAPHAATYLLPLATRCRSLFKMDLAEAAYIAELRTKPSGHFSYRRAAWEMAERLRERYPQFGRHVRATDPAEPIDLLDR